MKCPKCKSEDVQIELVPVGEKTKKHSNGVGGHVNNAARTMTAVATMGVSNLFWKKSKGSETSEVINQKVCICQNCGHSWPLDKGKKGKI